MLCAAAVAPALRAEVAKEYQVKAAFLYNFTKFVEWPPEHFRDATRPITIAVFGRNPFGGELQAAVRDRTVNGRELQIVSVADEAKAAAADMIFVSAGEEEHFAAASAAWRAAGVLTVGESPKFAASGGVITFVVEGDRVRFEINIAAADASGLKVSAQLQKLATAIRRKL